MTVKEKSEWRSWWQFFCRRIREFLFLGIWVTMAWSFDVYMVHRLPIDGLPKYMMFAFEGLFDLCTLRELIILLFWPDKAYTSHWLNKRQGV